MFKTMWNMPARIVRRGPDTDDDVLANGSLGAMIMAAEAYAPEEGTDLIIICAGRDRPIGWQDIQSLRQSHTFPAKDTVADPVEIGA